MNKLFLWLLCTLAILQAGAQAGGKKIIIDPATTGAGINKVHSGHMAFYYPSKPTNHTLFLVMVGTGGSATDMIGIDSVIAGFGYRTLSLDYRNNVITTVCNNSRDSACFDKFRQEIMFGTPVSDSVDVDSTNSIINRVQKALEYLTINDPQGGWDEFIKHGNIVWSKIVVAGHSQGAGHAPYLAKHFKVSRALLFSGPQDYRVAFSSPAGWLSGKSATPLNRYYAFLHVKDPFNVTRQLAGCAKIMGMAAVDSAHIQPGVPLTTHKHILVNDVETNNAHMSTLFPQFKNVWEYMLKNED